MFDFFITNSTVFLIFFVGIIAAYFWSFSSWWVSALSIGLLTLLGIPPQMATVTFKLGKIWDVLGGIYIFHKNGHIPKRYLLGGTLVAIVGSFIGSYFIFSIPSSYIYLVSGISMLMLTIASYHKWIGIKSEKNISKKREYLLYGMYFFLTIVGNIFIAGSGIWYHFTNTMIIKLSNTEAKWLWTAISFPWCIGTIAWVLVQGRFNLIWAIVFWLGMFIGAYFGTKHIIKIGNIFFRQLLLSSIVFFALYFLYLGISEFIQ